MNSQRFAFSFVVDANPRFSYQGWLLAHSIMKCCRIRARDIHVQFTPDVDERTVRAFFELGCATSKVSRFGDGKFCNKIAQWENLKNSDCEQLVLLDSDTILVADCRLYLPTNAICAKVVDLANPSISVLDEIMKRAGFETRPEKIRVDASEELTYRGNCNGGMYSIPMKHGEILFSAWRRWAGWLLENMEPLRRVGKEMHADQVSFCLAMHETGLPLTLAPSNLNYFLHFAADHHHYTSKQPISILHYHNQSINVLGLLEPALALNAMDAEATAAANGQIREHFDNRFFWDFRYAHHSARGSGVGSRGANLIYKRQLLRDQGAERAASVLDVGCGDLEIVKTLELQRYVGVDQSPEALALARKARPEWTFVTAPGNEVRPAELVLCFEVLIHQETAAAYHSLIDYLASKTENALIVSGYEYDSAAIRNNSMLFYYEPLSQSLARTNRFTAIKPVGKHSDVCVYRCEVRRKAA